MKISADFCVESGGKCYVMGKVVTVDADATRHPYLMELTYQQMSREMSREIIKNTTMLAHLVTHPHDTE
jgi:hypothetical protein